MQTSQIFSGTIPETIRPSAVFGNQREMCDVVVKETGRA
jgi:hypothetical protein